MANNTLNSRTKELNKHFSTEDTEMVDTLGEVTHGYNPRSQEGGQKYDMPPEKITKVNKGSRHGSSSRAPAL